MVWKTQNQSPIKNQEGLFWEKDVLRRDLKEAIRFADLITSGSSFCSLGRSRSVTSRL